MRTNPALAFLWRDQCNFSKLSLNPNLFDTGFMSLTKNAKAVLTFHPPVMPQDRFELGSTTDASLSE